jgi:hypothetical protein
MITDFIDFSKVYRIEAIPSRDSEELAKKGLGTFPGITQTVTATWNDKLKKFANTGFDENDTVVLRLPADKRKEVQERIIAKREELETLMGMPGYLKPTSEAWLSELCITEIEVGQDLKIRVNGHTNELRPAENYKDAISLAVIFSNPTFPKTKSDISDPEYKNAKFYLTTSEETTNFNKGKIQKTRKANIEMAKLFDEAKNKQRAWEIAFKLGLVNKQKVDGEVLEMKMQDAVFNDKTGKTLEAFLEACEFDNATLTIHNMFQQGINIGVIRVSPDGYYHRGHNNYRKTKQDSIAYLMSAGMEVEMAELRSEVEGRKKKHNAIG